MTIEIFDKWLKALGKEIRKIIEKSALFIDSVHLIHKTIEINCKISKLFFVQSDSAQDLGVRKKYNNKGALEESSS